MSTFDPETGVRRRAEQPAATPAEVAQQRRNPYETALAATWVIGGVLAFVLVLCSAAEAGSDVAPADPAPLLLAAVVVSALAIVAGIAHLAVRAIGWRPPER